MDEDIMQQGPRNEGGDSFLDGWDDARPGPGDAAPAGGGESRDGPGEEAREKGGGEEQPGGTSQDGSSAQPVDSSGGEERPPAGGSGDQPDSTAQLGNGGAGGQPEEGRQPPPPKTWTLDHMGQAVTISEADVPLLAQKALDYDRVSAAYEEARPVMDLFRGFARKANLSVPEYVARLRTQAKQLEGLDEAAARRAVEMEDREARVAAQEERDRRRQEQERQSQETQRRRQERVQADIQEFISVFPEAARDFQKIPQDVWNAVNGGMSLVAAYARYNQTQSNARAQAAEEEQRRQEAVQRQNQKNAAASTGSMRSAGSSHGPKDPFLEGWDE